MMRVITRVPFVLPGREARLLWTETNTDRVRRATIHGTRQGDVASVPHYGVSDPLIWPRAIVADPRPAKRGIVYVAEYLGRVWELGAADDNRTKHAKLVVDHAGLGAAAQIRSFLAQSERSSAAPAEPRNVLGSYLRLSV